MATTRNSSKANRSSMGGRALAPRPVAVGAEAAPTGGWHVVPGPADAQSIAQRCRRLVNQRALVAAGVAMIPVPGLDWVTDVGLLVRLLPRINQEFGLTPDQVERLAPDKRVVVYKALSAGSTMLVGKLITRDVVIMLLKAVGVRLTAQQAAKFVPVAGQAVSAALTFSALKYVCELHIRQCVALCEHAYEGADRAAEQAELRPVQRVR